MISSRDKLKLELDKYIRPERGKIHKMVVRCLKIIYNNLITNHNNVQAFTLHLNVEGAYDFSMVFRQKGSMLSPGASLLADSTIYFADWKCFHDWIFYGLREMQNQYLIAEGIPNIIAPCFDSQKYFKEFMNVFDEFTTMSQFAVYSEMNNLQDELFNFLRGGAIISLYNPVRSNSGEFYIFFDSENVKNRWDKLQSHHQYKADKFYLLKEINPKDTNGFTSSEIAKLFTNLNANGFKIQLFRLQHRKYSHLSFTIKDAFRVFDTIKADYLILDPFVVESRIA